MPRPFRFATLFCLLLPLAGPAAPASGSGSLLELSLNDALQRALARNFSIEVSRFEPRIARERVTSAEGRFDPRFDARWESSESARRDLFLGGTHLPATSVSQGGAFSSGLSGLTPWGLSYDVGFGIESRSGTFNTFDEDFTGSAGVALRQPLLQGAGTASNLAQVRIARNNALVSEWQLRQRVTDTITQTVFIYNELHLAHEALNLAKRSQALAQQLLDDNIQRTKIGVMSPLNITTARAEVAAREEGVIVAQRLVKDNENFLKQLITNDLAGILQIRLAIAPPPSPAFRADVPGGIRAALATRPDYRQAILELERRQILLSFEKNQALPRLDLTASLRMLGFDNDAGTSASRIASRDQSEWTAGAIFSVPIPNREGRGAVNAAKLSAAQSLVSLQRLEQQIIVDVDNASGQVASARERIVSTAEASKLARESLDAGEERLRAGTSTTFEVLELQKRLVEAEFAQLRARADYNKAVNEYYRQTGTTLDVYRIKIAP